MKKWMLFIIGMLILLMNMGIASAQQAGLLPVTYQRFERGIMIWRGDTGHIWAIGINGTYINYPASSYGNLPNNAITAPAGFFTPIMGFGKVWGNHQSVRDLLGYATSEESSTNALYQQVMPTNVVFLTLGEFTYQLEPDTRWVAGTLTNTANITNFTISPTTPQANGTITVNWATQGGEFVMIELHDATTGRLLGSPVVGLSGATTLTLNNASRITVTVWVLKTSQGANAYQRLAFQSQTLTVTGGTGTVTNPPATGQCTLVGNVYTVQRGDTLYRIARRCGVSVDAIVSANGITNRNRIYTGQRLIIPAR